MNLLSILFMVVAMILYYAWICWPHIIMTTNKTKGQYESLNDVVFMVGSKFLRRALVGIAAWYVVVFAGVTLVGIWA